MVNDQLHVGGYERIFLEQIQQVVCAHAWDFGPLTGEIFPYRDARRASGADARLPFVLVDAGLLGFFKFFLKV